MASPTGSYANIEKMGEPAGPSEPFRLRAFDPRCLDGFLEDPANVTACELSDPKLVGQVLEAAAAAPGTHAFSLQSVEGGGSDSDDDEGGDACCTAAAGRGRTRLSAGLGVHMVDWNGASFAVVRQAVGIPVGTGCAPALMESVVVATAGRGKQDLIQSWASALLAALEVTHEKTFTIYHWHQRHHYWRRDQVVHARPMASVVLPEADKTALESDFHEFLSRDTAAWYKEHGIPYKRAYLFFGPPGAGKTSLIQALAGLHGRNVCYVQPAHKEMTDDVLQRCLQHAPKRSILVLEDVDALFDEKRVQQSSASSLTFTGLLNSLDGIGNAAGQIFILTTNHRERLDAALIRNGRVDCHVKFSDANDEQLAAAWRQFKGADPEAAGLATEFVKAVRGQLNGKGISMAAVQGFFVKVRKDDARASLARVGVIAEDIAARADDAAKETKAKKAGPKKAKPRAPPAPPPAGGAAGHHIHLHLPAAAAPEPVAAPPAEDEEEGSGSEEEEE